ncbi:hypothetical protein PVAND_010790 [Polypedilum vanderplanki]|uniref:SOCS box domain-containing protein n=1 Tax=Polypedilum vanderplanki TaxID=319348 RepID=A0A9J6CGM5_POLVA|nr:hypothetical protein PVAND_010790 [Polypedilum vanderplanki]
MDFIFDCFFEEIFATLERNGLQSRHSRQNVIDQLESIITGCSAGQNVSKDETSLLAVIAAIKFHRSNKDQNSKICKMGKYHNVLYIALKVAWNWGINDSIVICELLTEIYECEKTFERLFLGAIFGTNAPYFIAGWRSDFRDQDENTRALVFFLHHACQQRLRFNVDGQSVPFIDVPIESCGKSSPLRVSLQASAPDILLILLRYGANPIPMDCGITPTLSLLEKLIEYNETASYPYQLVSCFKILMLATPSIVMPFIPFVYKIRKQMFLKKYSMLIDNKIVMINRVFGVPELKHLCRCSIREVLRENCQLPHGIKLLKVPRSLKRYLDLLQE